MKIRLIIVAFLCPLFLSAQIDYVVKGRILDSTTLMPIVSCTIIIQQGENILGFSITSKNGTFNIPIKSIDKIDVSIVCRHISYLEQKLTLTLSELSRSIEVILLPSSKTLDGVMIKSGSRPINDTTEFKVDSLISIQTRKVEDLLKVLPGFEIMPNGQIKYKDQGINSVLVNGENLTGGNYGVVTKNLDADVLSKVQVINNSSSNRIIGSIFKTGDVAINLITKDDLNGKVNASFKAGSSIGKRYDSDLNVIALKGKVQGIFVGSTNNIGENKNPDFGGASRSVFLPELSDENSYFSTTNQYGLNFPFSSDNYKVNEKRSFAFPSFSLVLSPKFKIIERLSLNVYENDISTFEFNRTNISASEFYILNNNSRASLKNVDFNISTILKYDNLKRTAFEIEIESSRERKLSNFSQYQTGSFFDSVFASSVLPINSFNITGTLAHKISEKSALGAAVKNTSNQDVGFGDYSTNRFSDFYNQSLVYDNLRQRVNQNSKVMISDIFYLLRQKAGSLQLKLSNAFYRNNVAREIFLDSMSISESSLSVSKGLTDFSYYKSSFQFLNKFRTPSKQDIELKSVIGFYDFKNTVEEKYLHYIGYAGISGKLVGSIFYGASLQSGNALESPSILLKDSLISGIGLMSLRANDYRPFSSHSFSFNLSKADWFEYKLKYSFRWIPNSFVSAITYDPKLTFYNFQIFGGNFRHKVDFNFKAYSLKLKGTFFADVQALKTSSRGIINQREVFRSITSMSPSIRFVSNFVSVFNFEIIFNSHLNSYLQKDVTELRTTNSDYVISSKQKVDVSKKFIFGFIDSYIRFRNGSFVQLDFFSSWQVSKRIRLDFKGINLLNRKSYALQFNDVNNIFRQETFVAEPYFLSSISFKF